MPNPVAWKPYPVAEYGSLWEGALVYHEDEAARAAAMGILRPSAKPKQRDQHGGKTTTPVLLSMDVTRRRGVPGEERERLEWARERRRLPPTWLLDSTPTAARIPEVLLRCRELADLDDAVTECSTP